MKKAIFFTTLVAVLLLVVGAGCTKQKAAEKTQNDEVVNEDENNFEVLKDFEEGRILVDRVRYVQAGSPPFDFTNIIFHQKSGNGYKAEIISDKNIKVEVMTDKDCLLKAQGDEYKIIREEQEGKNIVIVGEKNADANRNLCIGATASGSGETEIKFKVVELI